MGGIHGSPKKCWVLINSPRMINMPSQNDGMAMPAMANPLTM